MFFSLIYTVTANTIYHLVQSPKTTSHWPCSRTHDLLSCHNHQSPQYGFGVADGFEIAGGFGVFYLSTKEAGIKDCFIEIGVKGCFIEHRRLSNLPYP
jgi:hypothetical protein